MGHMRLEARSHVILWSTLIKVRIKGHRTIARRFKKKYQMLIVYKTFLSI